MTQPQGPAKGGVVGSSYDDLPACRELERLTARLTQPARRRSPTLAAGIDEAHLNELEAKIIWIFGSGRSGSSWLMRLLQRHRHVKVIDESGLGEHLVDLRTSSDPRKGVRLFHQNDIRSDDPNYFFCRDYTEVWGPLLRQLVLTRFSHHLKRLTSRTPLPPRARLVIKEPNGSHAASSIMYLLSTSSLIFLVRDGRDVVDSAVAATSGDSWGKEFGHTVSAEERFANLQYQANLWAHQIAVVQRAYAEVAPERRMLVQYEQLLSDTAGTLAEILAHFELEVDEEELRALVAAEDFEAIPPERRGPTKEARAATPGLWREHFTRDEQRIMETIMGEKLRQLGYPS
jgi:Sulfotransferase family